MFRNLLLSSSLLLLIPGSYLYFVYLFKSNRVKKGFKIFYWASLLVLCIGLYLIVKNPLDIDLTLYTKELGIYTLCYFFIVNPLLFLTLGSLLGFLFRKIPRAKQSLLALGGITSILSIIILLYGSIFGREQFDVKSITYTNQKIPTSFNHYKIVQISDLHLGSWYNKKPIHKMVNLVNQQNPDLIVFTGDLVNHKADEITPYETILSQLKAKDGVYSILGNHDYGPYYKHWKSPEDQHNNLLTLQEKQRKMGWTLLNNEHTFISNGKDSIALIGVENDGEPPFAQYGDLKKASQGTERYFQILLSHNPTHWRREVIPTSDIPLTLSGHTHGMQFQLGSYSLASKVYPEWSGLYSEGKQSLYVNVGLGSVGPPFRWGAWPEITVITLMSE